jgi:hypothetical protein
MNKLSSLSLYFLALVAIAILLTIYLLFKFYLIPGVRLLFVILAALFSYTLILIIQKKAEQINKTNSERITTIFLMIIVIAAAIMLAKLKNSWQWEIILTSGLFLIYCWIKLIFLNGKIK